MPIQVGAALSDIHWGIQRDDEKINISKKNKNYCELTAHYWFWKNYQEYDYVGLCHYRRFFDIDFTESNITKLLKQADVILPQPIVLPHSNGFNLSSVLTREDLYILMYILKTQYPDYMNDVEEYLFNSNKNIACNMFITKASIFQQYSEWLFPLLQETEKYVRLSGYTRLQRIYGYFSEVLLPIWIKHNHLKIIYTPLTDFPNTPPKRNFIKEKLSNLRNNICFYLQKGLRHRTYLAPQSTITSMKIDGLPLYE